MRKVVTSVVSVLIAIVGLIGGGIWAIMSGWGIESLILTICSGIEIIGFLILKGNLKEYNTVQAIPLSTTQQTNVHVNVGTDNSEQHTSSTGKTDPEMDRNLIVDYMKTRLNILFIDDDKNFNVVKILKDSGWKLTKTVTDVKTLEASPLKKADVVFVDINGVGKLLNLEHQGLDLALMIKQKYENKRVVIYSANKNTNAFHNAWDECDYKLEKNALPYQFQSLVENYSVDIYNNQR